MICLSGEQQQAFNHDKEALNRVQHYHVEKLNKKLIQEEDAGLHRMAIKVATKLMNQPSVDDPTYHTTAAHTSSTARPITTSTLGPPSTTLNKITSSNLTQTDTTTISSNHHVKKFKPYPESVSTFRPYVLCVRD